MFINSINFLDDGEVIVKFRVGGLNGEILMDFSTIDNQSLEEIEYQVYNAVMNEFHHHCGLEFSNRAREESFERLKAYKLG